MKISPYLLILLLSILIGNHPQAQHNLAVMYFTGQGVPQNKNAGLFQEGTLFDNCLKTFITRVFTHALYIILSYTDSVNIEVLERYFTVIQR
jgi:hypothetical protein